MQNEVKSATVKADGRKVNVYKLKSGKYNIFLGDDISLAKVTNQEHTEQFEETELTFN